MRFLKALGCLVLLGALAAGAAAWWAWSTLHRPHGSGDTVVLVDPGTDAGTILARLEARGVIPDDRLARAWLIYGMGDPALHAGEYRFEAPLTTIEVLEQMVRGDVVLHLVTVVEGLSLEETAQALADAGFGGLDAFLAAMRDPGPIADLDPEAETLEGYLFPETYSFQRGATEAEIVRTLVATFRRHFEADLRPLLEGGTEAPDEARTEVDPEAAAGAEPAGEEPEEPPAPSEPEPRRWRPRSVRELVTLASIVEKEAKVENERRMIAAVYANRLEEGMGLYADPTVIFALKRRGEWDGNLTRENLQVDSPYNTYRYGGLPPGPIASPGLGSLLAAADPADVPHLYFVSRNDGTHVFADTLREHNANVQRWQREYWRKRWAEERRAAEDAEEEGDPAPPSD